jgi:carbamoyl-phosphate synthase small subunit
MRPIGGDDMRQGRLALADGTVIEGRALGADRESIGEVVFNTAMTGYEEILTDPSYAGQIVTMTYPEIGNYGLNTLDAQSVSPLAVGLIVKNACEEPSNWRAQESLDAWLAARGLVGLAGVDTRALTRKLRTHGSQMGLFSTSKTASNEALVARVRAAEGMEGQDLASIASTKTAFDWSEGSPHVLPGEAIPERREQFRVTVVDFGVKRGILRQLVDAGCAVHVVPFSTSADEILKSKPDGVVLSNGPGDPAAVPGTKQLVEGLVGKLPLMGICLGHQILALGLGGRTYKLKFGHRGGNHPVFEESSGSVDITSQNHGFAVDAESLKGKARVTHKSLFDGTVEGLELPEARAFSVQYHPEASPGPSDARHIFHRFSRMMERG